MNLLRYILIGTVLCSTATITCAQLVIDKPVQLDGATPQARQVQGLADPTAEADALNARSLQANAYDYAVASGTDNWSITLDPLPAALDTGMKLMVKVPATNTGPVTLDVATLGTAYVVKQGSLPLTAGDVQVGEVASLVYDGTHWQLLNARRLDRKPCPSGFTQVNELYCIETQQHDTMDFKEAAIVCGDLDAHLCSWGLWYSACVNASSLGLQDMVGDWEWTNSAANGDMVVRMVGYGTCTHAGTSTGWNDVPRNFRCCYRR